jgi:hypothetical protein
MFWLMMFLTFGLLSIATLSPIPLVIVVVVWVVSRPIEKPFVDEVIRTGGDPNAIPNPLSNGYGCQAFILWVFLFGSMGLFAIAALMAILEGKTL